VLLWLALYRGENYERVRSTETEFRLVAQLSECIPLDRVTDAPAKDPDLSAFDVLTPEDMLQRLPRFCADARPKKELGKLHHHSVRTFMGFRSSEDEGFARSPVIRGLHCAHDRLEIRAVPLYDFRMLVSGVFRSG
jgi:hypothetical protein